MPGLELFGSSETTAPASTIVETPAVEPAAAEGNGTLSSSGVYYNPRLDPKNFLEGPLSTNAATRLRQMLARPGIVVCTHYRCSYYLASSYLVQVAPGICDGISARCALEAGFTCLYQRYALMISLLRDWLISF